MTPPSVEGPQRIALRPLVALGAVLLLAAGVRFVGLAQIDDPYFDEKYYVVEARHRVAGVEPADRPAHPPLGSWLIAGGMEALGDRPIGWRVVPAAFGVVSVALTYMLAQLAWRRPWISVAAAGFVALDGMAVVTSRMAVLDGLQVPFTLGAVAAALAWDRSERHRWWWWLLAGAAVGAAAAIKWNGLMVLAPVVGLRLLRHRVGSWRGVVGDLAAVAAAVAVVYIGAYAAWFADYPETETYADRCGSGACGTDATDRIAGWFWEQGDRMDYHRRLAATHPNRSDPITWPLMVEPVTVYLATCAEDLPPGVSCAYEPDESRQIIAAGNPVLWWLGFAAAVPVLVLAVRRRRVRTVVVAGTLLALYLPWFASPKPGFLYFLTPAVPFLALVLARALGDLPRRWSRAMLVAVGAAFVAMAVFLAPIHYGIPIDDDALDARSIHPGWKP